MILSFDNSTGANTVRVGDTVLENLPVLGTVESAQLISGDSVGLLAVRSQYFILGRIGVTGGTVQFRGGSSIQYENGPAPPTPTAPIVEPTFLGLIVTWDGTYADGAAITPDWSRVEVHASDTSGFSPSPATFRAAFINPEGGDVTLAFAPETGEQYVRLVSRSLAGVYSQPSVEVAGTPGDVATFVGDIGGGTTVFSEPLASPPTATGIGDWWYTTDTAQSFRWDGTDWVEVDLPGVAEALAEAIAAQQAAAAKSTVYVQPTAPLDDPVGTLSVNDIWLDESDGHASHTWDGDSWEPRLLGTGAFQPDSIVASVVIATGTITGPLVEAHTLIGEHFLAGSVTAADAIFAAAAIQDADIARLNVGKLDAGTLHAILTISGAIRTAASGARSQMDGQGFRTFDMAENAVIEITGNNEVSVDTVLQLPGGFGDMATTPDDASLRITGDIDIRVRVAMDTWTPGSSQYFVGKTGSVDNSAYGFLMDQQDLLRITWSPDGTWDNSRNFVANAATGFADGSIHWVRATVDMDNGAGGCTGTFYTSENGIDWTQLGTSINASGVSSIFPATEILAMGARDGTAGFVPMAGRMYAAEVRDGINGTAVCSPVFTVHSPGDPSFVDPTGKTWTMNNNAALVAQPGSGGVPTATWRNPGNNSRIVLRPATDDLGDTVEARLYPGDVAGKTWVHGRVSAGVDNFVAGDNRPVTRMHAPINLGDPIQPAIALYGEGDVTAGTDVNLFADRVTLFGDVSFAGDAPGAVYEVEEADESITNSTFVSGTTPCDAIFTAPASGRVDITMYAEVGIEGGARSSIWSYAIWEGTDTSGTIVEAFDEHRTVKIVDNREPAGLTSTSGSVSKIHGGLTPGQQYFVRIAGRRVGTTGFAVCRSRSLKIVPVMR